MKSYTTNSIDPRGREGTNRNNLKFCFLSRELLRFETRTPSTHKKKRRLNIKSRVYTVAPVRPTLRKRRKMKKKKRKKCATSRKCSHCLIVYSLDSREVLEFYLMCICCSRQGCRSCGTIFSWCRRRRVFHAFSPTSHEFAHR